MQPDRNQQKAICYRNGNLLVAAGPGSGKTAVLTARIRYLTEELGVPERNILVLTFTRAAAEEMKQRYLGLAERKRTGVLFGTFHSVFLNLLKDTSEFHDLKITDAEEERIRLQMMMKESYGRHVTAEEAEEILSDFSCLKNGGKPADLQSMKYHETYEQICKAEERVNFDDLQVLFFRLLLNEPELLKKYRDRFRYLIVDEFQDINRIQYEILRLLCGTEGTVFAVGDDDQSIYGFRGSSPEFLKRFRKEFKHCGCIVLNRNYRSTGTILELSQRLIRNNQDRIRKHIRPIRRKGLPADIRSFASLSEEARYISGKIMIYEQAAAEAGLGLQSFAVLARTNAALEEIRSRITPEIAAKICFKTFHASKGLEFDTVFISHANDAVTPGKNIRRKDQLEEERRCFYVAMTRCRTYLHIFYTCGGYNAKSTISRFVSETMNRWKRLTDG